MGQWIKLPDSILQDESISPTALRDLCRLLHNARKNNYWHTDLMNIREIASVLGVERRNAYHRLHSLEELAQHVLVSPQRIHFRVWFLAFVPQEVQEGGFVQPLALPSVVVPDSIPNLIVPSTQEQQPDLVLHGGGVGGDATRYTLCASLCTLGVSQDVALRLVTTYTSERIELQIMHYEWALEQDRADGPGWLVKAIEKGYDPPDKIQEQYDRSLGKRQTDGPFGEWIDS